MFSVEYPTAVHASGAEHDTPFRTALVARFNIGTVWIVQPCPSHCSAIGTSLPGLTVA